MNNSTLGAKLKQVDRLVSENSKEDCLTLCAELVSEYPETPSVFRKKADVLEEFGELDDSYSARQELINLGDDEPADFYDLALLSWRMQQPHECIEWTQKAITACKKHDRNYYYQASNFYKAVSEVQVGYFEDALQSSRNLEDGYKTYVYKNGMISKEAIIEQAQKRSSWSN